MERKQILIDHINVENKSLSIAIDTLLDTSQGTIRIGRWRCAYTAEDGIDKLVSDLNTQAPDADHKLILDLVDGLWQ